MTVTSNVAYWSTARPPGARAGFTPFRMLDVELTGPLPAVARDGERQRAWVLARLHTEPVGACAFPLGSEALAPGQLGGLLWPALRDPVTARFAAAGLPRPAALTGAGLTADPAAWPFLRDRRAVLAAAPSISVVVCTRGRAELLENCLLQLERLDYPRFEVVVVDNAPATSLVRTLVTTRSTTVSYRYTVEPRGGLSWARNAGIAAASSDIIAFLDDDDEPDPHWLTGLARGFARGGDIGCVTGMTIPARLDTPAQELFERLGGHGGARGFSADVFSRHGPQDPLYPLPPFGAGANMAFRREALAGIGGFDVALGAGTPAAASEDTLAFTQVLLAGYRIAYEPAALMRHHHRPDLDGLYTQVYGYGVGTAAYYAALLRHRPSLFPAMLRLMLPAAGYLLKRRAAPPSAADETLARLVRHRRRGMVTGPAAYVRSVCRQARVAARGPRP